jgi:adenylate cyclase
MSSAEVQANVLANLLDQTWFTSAPAWVNAAGALALVAAIWGMLLVLPLGISVPASALLLGGWGWFAWISFERGVLVGVAVPLLAGILAFATTTITLAAISVRERRRVKGLFARYVHADVVRDLVDGEDRIELAGEAREITVLFSDIRGFTSLSEHVDPVEMVAQLNEYFEAMVQVVTDHDGAVDKFLGDGLMAIFGAPAPCEEHAARACDAADAMLERLEVVNARRAERALAPLQIGIGIHTGVAVVGNVGSPPFRVDFTAIGDTVNLAARLEAMTKELGSKIVVSGSTVEHVPSREFHGLGTVVVRGRTEPTEVFALDLDSNETGVADAA